jgi:hypothetical protein
VAVPSPLFTNTTPLGNVPASVSDGVGVPVVVTVKLPAVPTVKILLLPLVNTGAILIVKLAVSTPLLVKPLSVPMALRVSEALTVTAPPFASEVPTEHSPGVIAAGLDPSVV